MAGHRPSPPRRPSRPGRATHHPRPVVLVALSLAGVLVLAVALCGVGSAARSVLTQTTRSPATVVDAYVFGLWRWVGDIGADRGLRQANHESCEGLHPVNRALRTETDR